MAEYATKGQGTAGVTLGTIGTVLGGLATLGGVNGGGLLGGICRTPEETSRNNQ